MINGLFLFIGVSNFIGMLYHAYRIMDGEQDWGYFFLCAAVMLTCGYAVIKGQVT